MTRSLDSGSEDGHGYNNLTDDEDVEATFKTQPTQILATPKKLNLNGRSGPAQSAVQVTASSPAKPLDMPSPANTPKSNGLSTGRPHPMAPPGTQFRHPSQRQPAVLTQPDTQQMNGDDLGGRVSDSDDNGDDGKLQPSIFSKGSHTIGTGQMLASSQPGFSSHMAKFAYASPQKRPPPDDMASAYARGRADKVQRRHEPLLQPSTKQDMTLEDIHDFGVRRNTENLRYVFPQFSVFDAWSALMKKRGSYEDAMDYLAAKAAEEDQPAKEQETINLLSSDDEKGHTPRQNAKRTVGKLQSIASRYTAQTQRNDTSSRPSPISPATTQPRKRIVRPGASKLPLSDPPSSPRTTTIAPNKQASRKHVVESDESNSDVSAQETDSEVSSNDAEPSESETRLLTFINNASAAALRDLSSMPAQAVSTVIGHRPYSSLDDIRAIMTRPVAKTKRTKAVAVGDRLVDACLEMWSGYDAIDSLVSTCQQYGEPIIAQMKKWGLATFGGGRIGELEMTHIGSEYDALPKLQKPQNMSPDLVMKDYQIAGLNWLALLFEHGLSAILADDMGLGKTCQVIAFMAHLKDQGAAPGLHLVVVPGSTLENWLREIRNFCPMLNAVPYYGGINERPSLQVQIESSQESIDLVVTTYDIAVKDADNRFLRKLRPIICVYDEAHQLKNSMSDRYRKLMRIPAQRMRLMLTGTPLQNNLMELGSMLGFLMPGIFSEHEDSLKHVFKQKAKVQSSKSADSDGANEDTMLSKDRIARARSMLTPFILRRKKDQVLKQLPTKTNSVVYCQLDGAHHRAYKDILSSVSGQLSLRPNGEDKKPKATRSNALMDLRKASIHPLLFRRLYDDETVSKIAREHVELDHPRSATSRDLYEKRLVQSKEFWGGLNDYQIHRELVETMPSLKALRLKERPWMDSSKVQKLLSILDSHAQEGHTTLIFSQFTTVMDILEAVFETSDVPFYRLDGSTDMNTRQKLIDDFTQASKEEAGRAPVFMLSTKAGGQGINLTCADRVIIFDSGYNPQDDIQAENRAHRVGQTREVEVVRLVVKDTIEEAILALGERKLKLDELVAGSDDAALPEDPKKSEAEEQGAVMVERLFAEQLRGRQEASDMVDIGESFMKGLKKAGLDMSAAARAPVKRSS